MRLAATLCLSLPFLLAGCGGSNSSAPGGGSGGGGGTSPNSPAASLKGVVSGAVNPVVGAHVFLFAANTTGYGGSGLAVSTANASLSLLTGTSATALDTTTGDYYATTDSGGAFTLTGAYTCTVGQQVYLYALGGNPGFGTNTASGLMTVLGACPNGGAFDFSGNIAVNEMTTVAAAYALAGFASSATHISSSGTSLAKVGLENAFLNAANLASITTGAALTQTPAGNGTVPQTTLNTIADILASCVNSAGATSAACVKLFANIKSAGATGTSATDTATAAIYLAQNPYPGSAQMTNLFSLVPASAPFLPDLGATMPPDFEVALSFTGGGLSGPWGTAIDGNGNVWIVNYSGRTLSELSSTGAAVSPSGGYPGGGLAGAYGLAIDTAGNVWVGNAGASSLVEFSNSGSVKSGSGGYTGGGLNKPGTVAIDGNGNVWLANYGGNSISEFTSSGAPKSGQAGYTGGGLNYPEGIAIDGSGNAWVANGGIFSGGQYNGVTVSEFSSAGMVKSGAGFTAGGLDSPNGIALDSTGNVRVADLNDNKVTKLTNSGAAVTGSPFSGGGIDSPQVIAIDGAGNAWVANNESNTTNDTGSVTELSSAAVVKSSPNGFAAANLNGPVYVAVDGSGDVWITSQYTNTIAEIIGSATPVITPICAGLSPTLSSNGTSNLGTRP